MKRQIFVIMREDRFHSVDVPVSVKVVGTKAYFDEDAAIAETARLQSLKPVDKSFYFVTMARIIGDEKE